MFSAKKIRIQIPCGGSGSLMDPAGGVRADPVFGNGPDGGTGCGASPKSAFCPDPPKPPPPPPPCGVPSNFNGGFGDFYSPLIDPEIFVLSPEDLPKLRRQIEFKLQLLALADQTSALAKQQLETKLEDIANMQEALKEDA